jgi:hypothetical protein
VFIGHTCTGRFIDYNSIRHKHEYIRDLLQRNVVDIHDIISVRNKNWCIFSWRPVFNWWVCRIVIKSVQQYIISYFLWICFWSALITNKEPCKFAVNKRQNTNYSFLPVTSKNKDAHDVFEDLTKARRCNPKSLMCGYLIINSIRHKHEYIRDLLQRNVVDIHDIIDGNFRSQKAKSGTISCLMWNIYLYFIILKLFTNFQSI